MMTERVKNMFIEAFKREGLNCDSIYADCGVAIGLECLIPRRWVLETTQDYYLPALHAFLIQ